MPWKPLRASTKKEEADALSDSQRKTRFLIDESVDHSVTWVIRRSGWNAVHVQDCGLKGHPDENVMAYAKRENRMLITHDIDFLDNGRFPLSRSPGLILIPGAEGVY